MKDLSRGDAFVLLFSGDASLSDRAINKALGSLTRTGQSVPLGKYKITRTKGSKYTVEKVS